MFRGIVANSVKTLFGMSSNSMDFERAGRESKENNGWLKSVPVPASYLSNSLSPDIDF